MRLKLTTCVLFSSLVACHSGAGQQAVLPADNAGSFAGLQNCERRVNDTLPRLEACIQQRSLWQHLAEFQKIADANPGPHGHPNRDTGTPGYHASAVYVANLMRAAGYKVTIQRYDYRKSEIAAAPAFGVPGRTYAFERDWFVARNSGGGTVTALVEPRRGASAGCVPGDFAGFGRGNVALLERGGCDFDTQVANARTAGAGAVILYNDERPPDGIASEARLIEPAKIPVIGLASYALGADLLRQWRSGSAPTARIVVRTKNLRGIDYNVIADSPFGDVKQTIVLDAHLDSIYGAGMLDNASGSTTILEIGLAMARTPTRNHLRYIWFGGEEIGLLGSKHYVGALTRAQLHQIAFDVDVDVTATPNYDILIAAAANSRMVKHFPPNVVPESKIGNDYFTDFFNAAGVVVRNYGGGSDGTDSLSFGLAGVPNSGILTQQDCCKHTWETHLWGGFLGNYEGMIPSHNGGCVDRPHRWCDNLSNNDPFVLELASKAVAYAAFELANRARVP
jgi:hypothetical protein